MVKTFLVIIGLVLTLFLVTLVWVGSFDGLWVGEYVCCQGKIVLVLIIGVGLLGKLGVIF